MNVRILVDANLPRSLARRLRERGVDVLDLRDRGQAALPDAEVYDLAVAERRILVSLNYRDFGNIVRYPPAGTEGILVVRMPRSRIDEVMARLLDVLGAHDPESFRGRLVVVETHRVRWRRSWEPGDEGPAGAADSESSPA